MVDASRSRNQTLFDLIQLPLEMRLQSPGPSPRLGPDRLQPTSVGDRVRTDCDTGRVRQHRVVSEDDRARSQVSITARREDDDPIDLVVAIEA
jgi:hypothetical protein